MISVIMPCYNAGKYIKEAIESVLNQSYKDWELIIVNDGSTDDSLSVAESFSDKRIRIFSQPNSGACVARNKGIELASGEYLKFLDADDILEKDCLKNQIEQIKTLKENQVPFGDYDNIDESGKEISAFTFSEHQDMLDVLRKDQPYFFFHYWHILISSPLLRKKDLVACGGYDVNLERGQEFDMHFRLALQGVEFVYSPTMTFSYREYTSPDRISSQGRKNEQTMKKHREIRNKKCEQLLLHRYGSIPQQYCGYFSKYWFDRARTSYAGYVQQQGDEYLRKAQSFGIYSFFMKCYVIIGRVIGYQRLETLLRVRLRIIGKS